ncbi:MAG: Crp/Fnr family transcriptional regulator [Candidatus Izemoplasmatales bacterium]
MKIDYQKYPLFHGLMEDVLAKIDQSSSFSYYEKGNYIHLENDFSSWLEIIIEGECHVEQIDEVGNEKIIKEFHKSDILGLNNLFSTKNQFLMYIYADTYIKTLKLPKKLIDELLDIKGFRDEFIRLLSDHTINFAQSIKRDFRHTLRQKIIHYISSNLEGKETNVFELKISKTRLAKEFGVQRTSLSRELQKMKNEGLIDYHHKEIISYI